MLNMQTCGDLVSDEALPLLLRRRLNKECRRGCGDAALDDSDFCRVHHEAEKKHKRDSAARRRDALRKAKKCIDCEGASRKLRCRSCHRLHIEVKRQRRGVESERRGVESLPSVSVEDSALSVDPVWRPDRDGHTRYRGKATRGRPAAETLDEQDLDYAAEAIAKAKHGFELTQTAEVQALPRIQREAADRVWLAQLDLAERFFDELRERHKSGKRRA